MRSILAAVLVALPAVSLAQVKLEVSPHFASYYATTYTRYATSDSTERQEAGPGFGMHVTWRFNNIVGVQGSFSYIWSGIIPRYPADISGGTINTLQPMRGQLTFATVRGTVQPRRSNYYLAAGIGIMQRSGRAWKGTGFDDLTDPVAVLGFGIRARVTPAFAFNIGVDGNFYYTNPDKEIEYFSRRLQRDLIVSIGVPVALIER